MAYRQPSKEHALDSSGALSDARGKAVVIDSNKQLALAGANTIPDGVALEGGASGERMTYTELYGIEKVYLGGTVAVGDQLVLAANGEFVVGSTGENCVAVALEGGDSGEIITAQLGYKGSV